MTKLGTKSSENTMSIDGEKMENFGLEQIISSLPLDQTARLASESAGAKESSDHASETLGDEKASVNEEKPSLSLSQKLASSLHGQELVSRIEHHFMPFFSHPQQRQRWGDAQLHPHTNWGDIFFDLFYVAA
jgi:hypothetical protein